MYVTNYQLMSEVQPLSICSNPDMMIIYAQELLMLSKTILAEVLINSSMPGRYSHNSSTGTPENHHRSKKKWVSKWRIYSSINYTLARSFSNIPVSNMRRRRSFEHPGCSSISLPGPTSHIVTPAFDLCRRSWALN